MDHVKIYLEAQKAVKNSTVTKELLNDLSYAAKRTGNINYRVLYVQAKKVLEQMESK